MGKPWSSYFFIDFHPRRAVERRSHGLDAEQRARSGVENSDHQVTDGHLSAHDPGIDTGSGFEKRDHGIDPWRAECDEYVLTGAPRDHRTILARAADNVRL